MSRRILCWLLGCIALVVLIGAPRPARAERGDELTVAVLTFGPGNEAFDKFGHNAIWIRDDAARADWVYNFGTYHFDSNDILVKFWQGRMRYWLSRRKGIEPTIRTYRRQNRTIIAQVLALTGPQKADLYDRLEENALPENREYRYDYYLDNCTTRVRDAIDVVTGGAVHEASRAPGGMTFRQHTLRVSADYKPLYVVLHLVMGGYIDKPIDQWAEMFLPEELDEGLGRAQLTLPDGRQVPLVKERRVIFESTRPPPPVEPPTWSPWFFLAGAIIGGGLALLGFGAARQRGKPAGVAARIGLGALLSLFGFVIGFLGWFYLLSWAFTPHIVGYKNENTLQCAPWAIALLVLGVGVAMGRPGAIRKSLLVVGAAAAFSALGLVLKALPWWFYQNNWQIIAFLLPFWAGATFGLFELDRSMRTAAAVPEPSAGPTKKKKKKAKPAEQPAAEPEAAKEAAG